MTVGNQAQTGLSEIAASLAMDDRVTAIGLHIEGIDDLRAFEAMAATAREQGIPIIALKIGRSDQAKAATVTHTASMAGSTAGSDALFRRLRIGRVSSLAEMLETLKLLHVTGPLASNRIASISCSGGEASLMADAAVARNLVYPPLNDAQKSGLRAALGSKVSLANPLDYHTYIWGDIDATTATFTAMMQNDLALGCVVLDLPRTDRCDASAWEPAIDAVIAASAATGRRLAVVSSLPETMPEPLAKRLIGLGIAPLNGIPKPSPR